MSQPLFSLIIPVYNVEQYLTECLDSAVNQSYKNYEIIIINDATEDDSESIINAYIENDESIKYIKLEKNVGLGFSRNAGLENAQGKYVFFLDADDWIEIDALAKLKTIIEDSKHSEIDLIVFNHQIVHDQKQYPNLSDAVYQSQASNTAFISNKQLLFKVFHVAWNKLYRLKFLRDNKLEFPQGAYEDIAFVLKSYSLTENIILSADSMYNYRLREGTPLGGLVKKGHRNDHFVVFSRYQQVFDDLQDAHLPAVMKTQIMQHLFKTMCCHINRQTPT